MSVKVKEEGEDEVGSSQIRERDPQTRCVQHSHLQTESDRSRGVTPTTYSLDPRPP